VRAAPGRRRARGAGLALLCLALVAASLALTGRGGVAGANAPTRDYYVSGWSYGDPASLEAAAGQRALNEVCVPWYGSAPNGDVLVWDARPDFVALARSKAVRVLATVGNWDAARTHFSPKVAAAILTHPRVRNRHIRALVRLCVTQGYAGIDLDWEALRARDRARFSSFVEQLARALHKRHKTLAIAVLAKLSTTGGWGGARAQDWRRLGAAVDEFKIMCYEFSGSWSRPGPIAPTTWASRILTFAASQVKPRKVMLGIPFYGRDWTDGGPAVALLWSQTQALIQQYGPTVKRDRYGEAYFRYTDGEGHKHQVHFQDRRSIAAKCALIWYEHPAMRGIAVWRMGGEDPLFWNTIRQKLKPHARPLPSPTP
jgi:spore germination protein YaaH